MRGVPECSDSSRRRTVVLNLVGSHRRDVTMMTAISSLEHDSVLASGLNVLVLRVVESPACQQFQRELDYFVRCRPGCAVWTVEAMQHRDLAERHSLRALPSIIIYRDGLPARRFAGSITADELEKAIDEVAAADMKQELNDWMLEVLETGEVSSPLIGHRPAADGPQRSLSRPSPTTASRPPGTGGQMSAAIPFGQLSG